MASIQKKNNKYCVVYYCKDTEGKRKQKWETYDTKNEAKIRKAEIELKEKKGGIIVSNCKTLEDLINEYVELYGKDRWALSTYDGKYVIAEELYIAYHWENSTDRYQYQISGDLL